MLAPRHQRRLLKAKKQTKKEPVKVKKILRRAKTSKIK
jgi:hypothetical protein